MGCRKCLENCLLTAADLKTGQSACVAELGRGRGFRAKMLGLGVRPGIEMKLVSGNKKGPCVVEVNCRKLMLGHEMLSGIIIKGEKDK